jgi:hypothetical protein
MPGTAGVRVRRPLVTVALALYAIFLAVSPFEHHDIQCELRTPLHCTACASTALGSDLGGTPAPGACHLDDAGSADQQLILSHGFLLDVHSSGRSPPVRS